MEPLADLMDTREEAARLLKATRRGGEWEIPDTAAGRINNLFKRAPKPKTIEILNNLAEKTSLDIPTEMGLYNLGKDFSKEVTRGSWRPGVGGAVGFLSAGPKGAGYGAAIGAVLDKWGGIGLGKIIDTSPATFRVIGKVAENIPPATIAAPIISEAIKENE